MSAPLRLADHATRDDLRIFLERLERAGRAEVRMVTRGSTLAVFGCTQAPAGLLDPLPVVLAARAFALAEAPGDAVDATVASRALLDRIARMGVLGRDLDVPDATLAAAWAGVLPPTSGWEAAGSIDAASLAAVAAEGMQRVAAALPDQPGEAVVQKVRAQVWGAPIADGVPAAAAFAADALGFLRDERVLRISRSRSWTRLSGSRGDVLVRGGLGRR
ncbi:hypothetical protein BMH32_01150 [Leucobacter sp. OLJS4]|uniref:hypothetical protein n=1 Tax=unclassified Leucobacter TaxID=2621730 RepID=UPI000C178435|nr:MULTISPECIES: hypothetical protein [unclassified Leucobacter]PII81316.1 hypothetical protein BMH25_12170 [Leucobacter sp. OLCALW19]PII85983.1 hypothetical protein BMH26_12585 [Leucobacter sp. OLTLW20]PII89879.1 hypothetical protein BMH27_10750 [Leucobacter sp. OLAS13]PII96910.1 hypothetical protein BMH29_11435 [Leucobacter sp. OLDS2]PII99279.1 hypothetical protein BMH28_11025 [Leucobacter sp. OLCS4]